MAWGSESQEFTGVVGVIRWADEDRRASCGNDVELPGTVFMNAVYKHIAGIGVHLGGACLNIEEKSRG